MSAPCRKSFLMDSRTQPSTTPHLPHAARAAAAQCAHCGAVLFKVSGDTCVHCHFVYCHAHGARDEHRCADVCVDCPPWVE